MLPPSASSEPLPSELHAFASLHAELCPFGHTFGFIIFLPTGFVEGEAERVEKQKL